MSYFLQPSKQTRQVPRALTARQISFTLALPAICLSLSSGLPSVANGAAAAHKEARFDVKYKETNLDIQAGDHLVITAPRGAVRLTQTASTAGSTPASGVMLKARKDLTDTSGAHASAHFEMLSLVVRRDGHTVFVEGKGPTNKNEWQDWLPGAASSLPEMVFEITVPAGMNLPIEIAMHDGSVVAQGLKSALSVSLVRGSVKTTSTEGEMKLQVQAGDLKVAGHHGSVEVDSFAAKFAAENVEGDLKMQNFSGESTLKAIKGNVTLRTSSGGTSVAKSSGAIDFDLGRGALKVDGFEGPLRGQTENAPVVAQIDGEAEVSIESGQGPVNVRLPARSAALVRLQTETGYLQAPETIRPANINGPLKTAQGRLTGDGPRGSVSVKTKTAAIRIKASGAETAGTDNRQASSAAPGAGHDASERSPSSDSAALRAESENNGDTEAAPMNAETPPGQETND
jgi:hypothetical protein